MELEDRHQVKRCVERCPHPDVEYSFTDIHTYTRNLSTVDTRHLDADWWVDGNWHVLSGASQSKSTNSQSVINNQSNNTWSDEWGLKYVPADGNSISLISRVIHNRYINGTLNYYLLVDTDGTEYQKEFRFNWMLTGKSQLSGNLMNIDHRFPTFYQRNYGGTQGGLSYFWGVSGKTALNVAWNRSINAWFDLSSTYAINDSVSIAPSWQVSARTNLNMSVTYGNADYFGPIAPNTLARHDSSRSEALGLDWSPQRSVKISASVQSLRRSSNYMAYEYDDTTSNLFLTLSF